MFRTFSRAFAPFAILIASLFVHPAAHAQCGFTSSPVSQTVCPGDTVNFTANDILATTLRWFKDGVALNNVAGQISGATTNTLTLSNVNELDQGSYECHGTGIIGTCQSSSATLSVRNLPVVTNQPDAITQCTGTDAVFSITASGTAPLTFQWFKAGVLLPNGAGVSGATTNVLTLTAINTADAALYSCRVTGACTGDTGNQIFSLTAQLTVRVPAEIQAQPGDVSPCVGASASLSVTVNANASPAPTFQWRRGVTNLVNGGRISGATSATLTINPVAVGDTAANYNCVVMHPCGNSTSNNTSISVETPVTITSITPSQALCTVGVGTITVVTSGSGPITYVWRRNNVALTNVAPYSGVGTPTLTITNPAPAVTGSFSCVVSNSCATNVISPTTAVTIRTVPNITQQPQSAAVCLGDVVVLTITAVSSPSPSFQWRKGGVNLVNGGTISGATTNALTINGIVAGDADSYDCLVSNPPCATVTSSAAVLTIPTAVAITTQPLSVQTIVPAGYSFSVAASGTSPQYQWRRNGINLVNAGRFSGVTTVTLSVATSQPDDYAAIYDCVVSNLCSSVTSGQASIYTCNFNESEANDSKAGANIFALAPGQTICGSSTGSAGAGAGSADYFRLNLPQLPGITRYRLAIVSNTGHVLNIRGLTQTAGVINAGTDVALQTATAGAFGRPTVQWYASGTVAPSIFVRITGSAATTTAWAIQLSAELVSPDALGGGSLPSGSIAILGANTDTEVWVYDASRNAIPDFGNDDVGGSTASNLVRTYSPGIYFLALGRFNMANNLPSPADDNFRTGSVADFAGITVCDDPSTLETYGASIGGRVVPKATAKAFEVRWIRFFIACSIADIAGLGGTLGPDGMITPDDLILYLDAFFAPNIAIADITGLGGLPNPPDGMITPDDLIAYLATFFAGCP